MAELQLSMQTLINSVAVLASKVEAIGAKLDNIELMHKNVEDVTKNKETVNRVDSRACVVRISVINGPFPQRSDKSRNKTSYLHIFPSLLAILLANMSIFSCGLSGNARWKVSAI
jgi:hypothetical protein